MLDRNEEVVQDNMHYGTLFHISKVFEPATLTKVPLKAYYTPKRYVEHSEYSAFVRIQECGKMQFGGCLIELKELFKKVVTAISKDVMPCQ